MASDQPVGIFDSGVGGLSVLREVRRILPAENLLYLADQAFGPYGDQPLEAVRTQCERVSRFLIGEGVKSVVVACNCPHHSNRFCDFCSGSAGTPSILVVGVCVRL